MNINDLTHYRFFHIRTYITCANPEIFQFYMVGWGGGGVRGKFELFVVIYKLHVTLFRHVIRIVFHRVSPDYGIITESTGPIY